jgi:hypothetical protein
VVLGTDHSILVVGAKAFRRCTIQKTIQKIRDSPFKASRLWSRGRESIQANVESKAGVAKYETDFIAPRNVATVSFLVESPSVSPQFVYRLGINLTSLALTGSF